VLLCRVNRQQGEPWEESMLTLVAASRIVDAALARGRELNFPPLTVAVLDAAGCLVAFKREDGSSLLREKIAYAKAWGTLGMGVGSRGLAEKYAMAPGFFSSVATLAEGRLIPVPGGVLIRSAEGQIIGAVGVSGVSPDGDEACCVHGVEAAGLVADTGASPAKGAG
jgi:uncharacterized protein GlcG (DUF336 family)